MNKHGGKLSKDSCNKTDARGSFTSFSSRNAFEVNLKEINIRISGHIPTTNQ
jgi:hypothetical protein